MDKISTILFDLDGTLIDPFIGITASVQHALRAFGIEREMEQLKAFIGPPLQDSFEGIFGFNEQETRRAIALYRERFSTVGVLENTLYPGVQEMLTALNEAGYTLGVASSKPEVYVKQICDAHGITQFFTTITGSELNGFRRDKKDVVAEALRRLAPAASADNTIMVGDRLHDVHGAAANGLLCIGISLGYAEEGELARAGALAIASDIPHLQKMLLAL